MRSDQATAATAAAADATRATRITAATDRDHDHDRGVDDDRGPLVLDRYRLHRRLGAGAFGTVWLARDERLERDVAVKILARDRVLGGRFEREARAAARLSHPGIVTLYEAAVDDEGAYLVSELVRGSTLDSLLAAGRLSDRDIVAIALALCDALDHAHAQGVVHRDVKPSNVLVADRASGRAATAKLTDFGVARVIDSDALTVTGDVLGTLAYMAPEQAAGLEADAAADLYSLALVTYEALTGVNPVAGSSFQRSRRVGAHLPALRRQRRDLPVELGRAIDVALHPRPRERGSIAQLRLALQAAQGDVDDEPGIVTGAWTRDRDDDDPEPFAPRTRSRGDRLADRADRADRRADRSAARALRAAHTGWPARGLAAATAAGFAAWTCTRLGFSAAAIPTPAVALVAAAAVLALPRLGWLALLAALATSAVLHGHAGGALVLALAGLTAIVLLPGRPTAWPVSTLAPALGLIGLAGAWPALAARAATPWRRLALGALGWLWLTLAATISGRHLYLPALPGVPAPAAWLGAPSQALGHVLPALWTSGALAPAGVWAVAALLAPWMVQGRMLALDVVRVVAWAVLTVAGTSVAIAAAHGGHDPIGAPPTALAGAAAAAVLALWPLVAAALDPRLDGLRLPWLRFDPEGPGLP